MQQNTTFKLFSTEEEALADCYICQLWRLSEEHDLAVDLVDIRDKLIIILRHISLPIIELPRTTMICRARRNFDNEIFSQESQLSINTTNKDIIGLGRFNFPQQGVFYGTVRVQENKQTDPVLNAIVECHQNLILKEVYTKDAEYTIGLWNTEMNINVLNFVLNDRWLKHIENAELFYSDSVKDVEGETKSRINMSKRFIDLISDLSSRPSNPTAYSITAAFFNLIYEYDEQANFPIGILYPSCKADGRGTNIVISERFFTPDNFKLNTVITASYFRPSKESIDCFFQYTCTPSNVLDGKFQIRYFSKDFIDNQFSLMIEKASKSY